jgi:hypothetical protein
MRNANFPETGFIGETGFIVARYSATNNYLPYNNLFRFQVSIVKVSCLSESLSNVLGCSSTESDDAYLHRKTQKRRGTICQEAGGLCYWEHKLLVRPPMPERSKGRGPDEA